MYQPYENSNVFKRLRQNILEKNIFHIFFLYFARVQNLKKTRARGAKHKYELDRPKVSKKCFDTQRWHVRNFSRNGSIGNVKFESEISMKTFVSTKFFYAL